MRGTFGGLSQYPKVWQPRSCPEERSLAPVPLYLDEMMIDSFKYQGFQMTNVFKQNFVQKL